MNVISDAALRARAGCEAAVLAFFHALDTRRHEDVAALMTPDGVWLRQGKTLKGRAEILEALQARPAGRGTCHVVANARLAALDGGQAELAYFLLAYESLADQDGGAPRLAAIRDCVDRLALTDEGWRIADKRSRRHLPPQ